MRFKLLSLGSCMLFLAGTVALAQTTSTQTTPAQTTPAQETQGTTMNQAATAAPQGNPENATIPSGTQLQIRTNEAIDATQSDVGRTYSAEIAENVMDANGNIIVPKGSSAELTVAKMGSSNMGVGSNQVSLALKSINVSGRNYLVQSNPVAESGNRGIGANKRTAEMTGGGALLGTLIGAVAGGGKGAAIGAAVGGAGGAAAQVLTRGNQVKVPAETLLTYKLSDPVQLQ